MRNWYPSPQVREHSLQLLVSHLWGQERLDRSQRIPREALPAPGWKETALVGMSCSQAASVQEVFPWDGICCHRNISESQSGLG